MLNRTKVIQKIINVKKAETYLEIGVYTGACFLRLRAPYKIGVDPKFVISWDRRIKYFIKNPWNINNHYYEMTSDKFFKNENNLLRERPIDVAFIDGLHTYKQSLRDVLNILRFLKDDGVIIMHDCSPPDEASAYPASHVDEARDLKLPGWTGSWCGDVWKAIVYLRSQHNELNVFVLDCDFGLGIVRKGKAENSLSFSPEAIAGLSYTDLEKNRRELINLKPVKYLEDFISGI